MNFSEFTKQKIEDQTLKQDDVMKKYEELKSLNNNQLTAKLFEEVAKQKQEGTFDYNSLVQSVESIKNFVPSNTYQNLKGMLENLK